MILSLLSIGKSTSGGSHSQQQLSDEEFEDNEYEDTNDITLTNIASGQLFGVVYGHDFFGENEISSPLLLDPLVAPPEAYNTNDNLYELPSGWVLKEEAFEPQVDLNALFNNKENAITNGEAANGDLEPGLIVNGNGYRSSQKQQQQGQGKQPNLGDIELNALQTVTIEDQTSALLCVPAATSHADWTDDSIIKSTIMFYSEKGDVQTAITMLLVIGQDRLLELFDNDLIEAWFMQYIDLLQRFNLFNVATRVMPIFTAIIFPTFCD